VLNIAIMISYLARSSKRVSHLISTHLNIMTSIVNQIQSSILNEAIGKLDRYEKMQCDENNIEYIQDKT
jgi:hypothetical protein